MRYYIAPSTITPVVLMGGDPVNGFSPIGGGSGSAASSRQYTTVTNTLVTSNSTTVTIPAGGKALVQSLDTEAIFVKLGAGATTSDFSFILKAGVANDDGNGGSYMIDDYSGVVSFSAAGTVRLNVALFS